MREIEFRGKDIETGEWVYGGIDSTSDCISTIYGGRERCISVDPNTIGQYTELKDINEVKVYEGDIIETSFSYIDKTPPHRKCTLKIKDVVTYGKLGDVDCFVLGGRSLNVEINSSNTKSEVIGNIYNDQELSNKK